MRNAWFEEEVHILQICHDYIFLLHGIRKYCLVDYCMDSLFVCEFFIIVRGCEKKLLHPHPTPEKRLSCVLVYPSSGTIAYISPPPLEKKWGLQWPYSILILGLHSSSPILPPHPTPLTTTQNKRICSEVLVVSLIYWVMCTLYEMVDQPITKNWQAVAYKTAVINSCVTKC